MKTQISVPMDTGLFLTLVDFLRSNGDPRDPVDVVSSAVEYWLDNASWKKELLTTSSTRGYQWKSLFLPDATEIRMQYKGTYFYAKVEGDEIKLKVKCLATTFRLRDKPPVKPAAGAAAQPGAQTGDKK